MTGSLKDLYGRKLSGFNTENQTGSGKMGIPGNPEMYTLQTIRRSLSMLFISSILSTHTGLTVYSALEYASIQ